ncbi:MAG: TlpA disulfide reductase family protein [Dehalococcoidia bacterium]|nr:TlpA disulfide reductase family protein [Dehalococcoidia bacterium]
MTDRRRRLLILGLVVLALAALGGLLGWAVANNAPSTAGSGAQRVGRPAPDFTITTFDGTRFRLSEQRGKVVVINFWASWCVPCREEAPFLERAWREYKDKGVVFVGVDIQDTESAARAYIKEFDITYPNGPDVSGEITIDYGVSGIPVTFFVDKEGRVAGRWVGAVGARLLAGSINDLLQR